jgi:hypothetical protein
MNDDEDASIRRRFDAWKRDFGEVNPPQMASRRGGPPVGRITVVALAVAGLIVAFVGVNSLREHPTSEVATVGASAAPAATADTVSSDAAKPGCEEMPVSEVDGLRKVATIVETSRFEASASRMAYPTLGSALRVGEFQGPAAITRVERIEPTPLNILPGENGRAPSNSAAGLSAYWAGVQVTVDAEPAAQVVRIPLAVGGRDVVAADTSDLDLSSFDALVGSCAILFTDKREGAGTLFGTTTSIVAVATAANELPVLIDGQFRVVRDLPSTLEGIRSIAPT